MMPNNIIEGATERDTVRRGLKMPDLRPYDEGCGKWVGHVQAIGIDFQRGCRGPRPQWLHQMRSDLGRLGAIAEILQVGPFLAKLDQTPARKHGALGVAPGEMVYGRENAGSIS
jgi:hypothetical protein